MTEQRATLNSGWTGFHGVNGNDAAVNTATTDLFNILDTVDVPIVVLRRDCVLVCFNKAAAEVLRLSPSDIGLAFRDISVLAGLPRLEEECSQVIASGVESRTDFRDGDKWFVVRTSPYTTGDRQATGTVLTFTNVTALRASIDQAIYERECTKAILNTVADPRVVLSADQRILSGNRAFYTMFLELASFRTQLKEMLAGSHAFQPVEVDHVFPGEGQRTLILDARPLSVPGHSERRVLVTFQDITAHKQAEAANDLGAIADRKEELRRSEAFLAEAQRLSLTGSFSWRVTTDEITWSDQLYRIFEFDQGTRVTLELIGTRVHPEDTVLLHDMIERARGAGADFEYEHRLQMPDQSIKYVHIVAHGIRDEDGRLEYIGAVQDVTARRLAEEELRRSEADLHEAQRLSHTGSWKLDLSSGSVSVSPEVFRIYAVDPDKEIASSDFWFDRIHHEDRQRVREHFERCVAERLEYEADYRIVLPDGTIKYQHAIGHPVLDESGALREFLGTTIDVTEQVQARIALENAFEEITRLKDRLHDENLALKEEIAQASMFEEVVGASTALRTVLSRVTKVAPTDSTVLLTGETGTGKELIARAIHKRSQRSSHAFVSVNCAAIPVSLIASELFGHEKGAFTGASGRRVGRFELAEDGTIFLDEVGELPAETQVALLRVLQERQFERVGGNQPIRANARVVAATNRDLDAAIAAGTFRSDLFYRLNVFPIEIPPLRERKEDIPLLVEYYIARFARKAGKSIHGISKKTLDLLLSYPWPGNIRELQNVVERSVVVCESETFSVDESWLSRQPRAPQSTAHLDLAQLAVREREIIEAALRESGGRVSGPFGAATKLGIPGSTLDSKLKALSINKNRFKP
jgi:formate hydrogenlyase transcriptional activator